MLRSAQSASMLARRRRRRGAAARGWQAQEIIRRRRVAAPIWPSASAQPAAMRRSADRGGCRLAAAVFWDTAAEGRAPISRTPGEPAADLVEAQAASLKWRLPARDCCWPPKHARRTIEADRVSAAGR